MPAIPRVLSVLRRAAELRRQATARALLTLARRLELGVVGRNLFDGVMVGVAAGLVGAALFAGFEYFQRGVLEEQADARAQMTGRIVAAPGIAETPTKFDPAVIVEYYSR